MNYLKSSNTLFRKAKKDKDSYSSLSTSEQLAKVSARIGNVLSGKKEKLEKQSKDQLEEQQDWYSGKVPVKIQYSSPQTTKPVSRIAWMLAGPIISDFDNWREQHEDTFLEIDFDEFPQAFHSLQPDSLKRSHQHWMGGEEGSVGEEHEVGKRHHNPEIISEHRDELMNYEDKFREMFKRERKFSSKIAEKRKKQLEDKKQAILSRLTPEEKEKKLEREQDDFSSIEENEALAAEVGQGAKQLLDELTADFDEEIEQSKAPISLINSKIGDTRDLLEQIKDQLDEINEDQIEQAQEIGLMEDYRDKYHLGVGETTLRNFPPYSTSSLSSSGHIITADKFRIKLGMKTIDIADGYVVTYKAPEITRTPEGHSKIDVGRPYDYYLFMNKDHQVGKKKSKISLKNIEKFDSSSELENRLEELFSATTGIMKKFENYANFKEYVKTQPVKKQFQIREEWENKGTPLRLKYGLSNKSLEERIKQLEDEKKKEFFQKVENLEKKKVEVKENEENTKKAITVFTQKKIKQEQENEINRAIRAENAWKRNSTQVLNVTTNMLSVASKNANININGTPGYKPELQAQGAKPGLLRQIAKLTPIVEEKKNSLWTPSGKKKLIWNKRSKRKFDIEEKSFKSVLSRLEKYKQALEEEKSLWSFDKKTKTYLPTEENKSLYDQRKLSLKLEKNLAKKEELEGDDPSKKLTSKQIKEREKKIEGIKETIDRDAIKLRALIKKTGRYQPKPKSSNKMKKSFSQNNENDLRKSIIENINSLEILWKSSREEAERLKEKRRIIKKMNSLIGEWECGPEIIQNANIFNALYSEFQSGEDKVKLEGEDNQYKVSTNGVNSLVTENFKEALAKYYSSVSRIMDAQNNNKDLALELFGEHVLNTSRNTRKLMAELDKMTEVKMLENLDYSQLSIPFNSDFIIKYEPQSDVFGIVPRTYDSTEVESQNNPGGKIGRKDLKESDYEEIELHPDEQDPIEEEPSEPGIGTDGANLITKTDKPSLNQPQLLPYRQEENKRTEKVEAPIKVKETYSQNLHPPEEKVIEGQHGVD